MVSDHSSSRRGDVSPASTLEPVGSVACRELTVLRGMARSARATIAVVELSTDGGRTWEETTLTGANEPSAGVEWEHPWRPASAGAHRLVTRATDSTGRVEPTGDGASVPVGAGVLPA